MKIFSNRKNITAADKIKTIDDLAEALENTLDPDLCQQMVNLAYSESFLFENEIFLPAEEFYDVTLSTLKPKDIALKFYNGSNLDRKGPADPDSEYMRLEYPDKQVTDRNNNVLTTDKPEDYYYDELLDDIIDYIIDHVGELEFPDDIQELIDTYQENNGEE